MLTKLPGADRCAGRRSLAELEVWYLNDRETRSLLLASWERFLSVCRVIVVCVYDQYAARQAPSPASLY